MTSDLTGQKIGEFVVLGPLGSGGSGDVYRSIQPMLQRSVALKILREENKHSKLCLRRFQREAILASWIDHPLAIQVFSSGQHNGCTWIAMELVDGKNLKDWICTHGSIPLPELVPMLEPLADVLAHLHAQGIIHRDIKPSNLMVTCVNGRQILRLLDMGIAKVPHDMAEALDAGAPAEPCSLPPGDSDQPRDATVINETLTDTQAGIGSSHFMPPEQWANAKTVVPESDVYALAVVVFYALTGRLPFNGVTRTELRMQHQSQAVPSVGGELAPDLDPILRRSLAKSPHERPPSALEFVSELRRVVSAKQARRAARMRRLLVTLIAALAFVMTALIVFVIRQQRAEEMVRSAQRVTQAIQTQSEVDQGRTALLFAQPYAIDYLTDAYRRGDRSAGTKFMLDRALQSEHTVARLPSSFGRQWSARYSPDGTKIVTADDRGAQVWDATSYKRLLLLSHDDEIYEAFFDKDNQRVITLSQRAIRIWRASDGALVRELKPGPRQAPADYFFAASSSDGRLVAASSATGSVTQVWDTASGRLLAELQIKDARFCKLAFSADDRWLAISGGNDVRVFDSATWTPTIIHEAGVRGLAFAPHSPLLLTGTEAGDVSIWTAPSGRRAQHLSERGTAVTAVAWAPSGQLVAVGDRKGAVQIWRASGEWLSEANLRPSSILSLELDLTSQLVLASTFDGAAVVQDVAGIPVAVFDGPTRLLRTAHFDAQSKHVLGASWDGTARIWDMSASFRHWSSPPVNDDCRVVTSDVTLRVIAVACKDHPTQVWDVSADRLLATLPAASEINGTLVAPAVSQSLRRVAIAHASTVDLYELPSGRLIHSIPHAAQVSALAFISLGEDVITGTLDGSLRLTRDDGATIAFPIAQGGIDSIGSLPNGLVVASDAARRLRIYDRAATLLADLELNARGSIFIEVSLAKAVVVPNIDLDATPLLVDLMTYQIIARLDGHMGSVRTARWIEANQVLTASTGGDTCRWSVSGQRLQCYHGVPTAFLDAGMTSTGIAVAGDVEGRLWFWDRDSSGQLWKFQAQAPGTPIVALHVDPANQDVVTFGLNGQISRVRLPEYTEGTRTCSDGMTCAIFKQ